MTPSSSSILLCCILMSCCVMKIYCLNVHNQQFLSSEAANVQPQASALRQSQPVSNENALAGEIRVEEYKITQLRGQLQSLREAGVLLSNQKLKMDAALATASMNASMLQLESTALSKLRQSLMSGVEKLEQQEGQLVSDAAEAAANARNLIQQRMTLRAQRDAALQRMAEIDSQRKDTLLKVEKLSSDIKGLEEQLGKAQSDLASAVKVYADRDNDLQHLVSDASSQLGQLKTGIKALANEKEALVAKVQELEAAISEKKRERNSLQDVVDALKKDIASLNADVATRSAAAEAAEKQLEEVRSVARATEAKIATLRDTRRSLELIAFTGKEEKERARIRAKELTATVQFLAKQRDDLVSLNTEAATRLASIQATIDGMRDDIKSKAAAVDTLQSSLRTIQNDTAALTAQRDSANNATIAFLVEASSIRTELYNISSELTEFRKRAQVASSEKSAQSLRQQLPAIPEAVLTALSLSDETADPEAALQAAMVTGPSEAEIRDAWKSADGMDGASVAPSKLRFRESNGMLIGTPSSAIPASIRLSLLKTQLNNIQSQVDAQKASNAHFQELLDGATADFNAAETKAFAAFDEKVSLAQLTIKLKDKFDMLRERVLGMRNAYFNSSDTIVQAKDEVDEMQFSAQELVNREKSWKERKQAAEDELGQLEEKRRDVISAISKAADDKVTQTQTLKSSISRLLNVRRSVAQDITQQEAAKLLLAQQVDYLKQQSQAMNSDLNAILSALKDLASANEKLKRQKEIASDELRLAAERLARVSQDLPAAQKNKEVQLATSKTLDVEVANRQMAADAADIELKTAKAEVERLTAEKTALNARIAEVKMQLGATQQSIVDLAESKAQTQIELDSLESSRRKLTFAVSKSTETLRQVQQAASRASSRYDRTKEQLLKLQQQLASAIRARTSLWTTLGIAPVVTEATDAPAASNATTRMPSSTPTADPAAAEMQQKVLALQSALLQRMKLQSELSGN